MSNYMCTVRTNHFAVTDSKRYDELIKNLICESSDVYSKSYVEDGKEMRMFGAYGYISYRNEDGELEELEDTFFPEIQKILPKGEAFVIMECGNEKLKYLVGQAYVITCDGILYLDMDEYIMKTAQDMVGNSGYRTKLDY